VTVGGSAYTGTGYFKFAVVNAAGNAATWSNDGSKTDGTEPTAAVTLTVTSGLFSVLLGDTSLANMTALPASAFSDPNRHLRVWFSSDGATFTLLNPDRRIAAVPYALQAQEALNADTLDGQHASAFQQHYANVIVVAKSGGDYATITAALNSITTASATNHYLVRVMPGVYTEHVTMTQYVDIEGAGELTTKITYTGGDNEDRNSATLVGANNAELRFLTVENTGGSFAFAIYNNSASPRLTHITASASEGWINFGVRNWLASPAMTNVTASASGGTQNYGVWNFSSSPTMNNVTASASGGTYTCGVWNWDSSSPTMTNVTASASGGTYTCGVWNYESSSPTMNNVTVNAWGGTVNHGVRNDSSSSSTINNSQITASSSTIYNDRCSTRVGASLLNGGPVSSGVTCAGVYDKNYTFYASTCP
jgi:hypothetical protein